MESRSLQSQVNPSPRAEILDFRRMMIEGLRVQVSYENGNEGKGR